MPTLTPEQIQQYKERFDRMQRYDEQLKIANILNKEKLDELVNLVNEIFARNRIVGRIDKSHIKFDAGYIGNIIKIDDKKLSLLFRRRQGIYFAGADRTQTLGRKHGCPEVKSLGHR